MTKDEYIELLREQNANYLKMVTDMGELLRGLVEAIGQDNPALMELPFYGEAMELCAKIRLDMNPTEGEA